MEKFVITLICMFKIMQEPTEKKSKDVIRTMLGYNRLFQQQMLIKKSIRINNNYKYYINIYAILIYAL